VYYVGNDDDEMVQEELFLFYMDMDTKTFPLKGYEHSNGNTDVELYANTVDAVVKFSVNDVCQIHATWKVV